MRDVAPRQALLALLATLLFLGALRSFFPLVYYSNLVALELGPTALFALLLLTPALMWLPVAPRTLALGGAAALVLGRALVAFTAGPLAVAAAGLAAGGFFLLLPMLRDTRFAAAGAALGFALDAALRWWGLSWDPTQGVGGLLLVVPLGLLLLLVASQTDTPPRDQAPRKGAALLGLALGAWVFLQAAVLASPYVVANWNGADADLTAALVVAGLVGGALAIVRFGTPGKEVLAWMHAPLVALLVDHLFVHSALVPLWAGLAQPALVADLKLLLARLAEVRQPVALLLAALVVLLAHFAYAFSYLFSYVPGGRLWEHDERWLLPLAALVVAAVAFPRAPRVAPPRVAPPALRALLPLLIAPLLAGAAASLVDPAPTIEPRPDEVRIATYNVHQGFDNAGKVDPWIHLEVIRALDADVLVLQEAEVTRFTSADLDLVAWLAARGGYPYHVVHATREQAFGGAILSRHRIEGHDIHTLPSTEDHRLYTSAALDVHGKVVALYSVHLGLPAADRDEQADRILTDALQRSGPVILAGDWNSCPTPPCAREEKRGPDGVYASITRHYGDAWVLAGHDVDDSAGYTYDAADPHQRIDDVFVTRDITVLGAEVMRTDLTTRASDHLPVVVTLRI